MSAPHAVFPKDIDAALDAGHGRPLSEIETILTGNMLSADALVIEWLGMIFVRHTDPDTEGGAGRFKYEAFSASRRYFYSDYANLGWLEG